MSQTYICTNTSYPNRNYGEKPGEDSFCIYRRNSSGITSPGCYQTKCTSGVLSIVIGDVSHECLYEGQQLEFTYQDEKIILICPNSGLVCKERVYDQYFSSHPFDNKAFENDDFIETEDEVEVQLPTLPPRTMANFDSVKNFPNTNTTSMNVFLIFMFLVFFVIILIVSFVFWKTRFLFTHSCDADFGVAFACELTSFEEDENDFSDEKEKNV